MIGVTSKGILAIPYLEAFLHRPVVHANVHFGQLWSVGAAKASAFAGWGRRASGQRAKSIAARRGVAALMLEDGFVRSYGTAARAAPLSLVVDDVGIYYDSTTASALENLLASDQSLVPDEQGEALLADMVASKISKYTVGGQWDEPALRRPGKKVLVVDQTAGDLSVALGGGSPDTFQRMLACARQEHPDAMLFVKTHPDVVEGRKSGYLSRTESGEQQIVLRGSGCPHELIEQMDAVYVVTSQLGFEALLHGKTVRVFGMPWYAGWGATIDEQCCVRRTTRRSVAELFVAAYLRYSRYIDPVEGTPGELDDVIAWIKRQRAMVGEGRNLVVGMRKWKQANLFPFLHAGAATVAFAEDAGVNYDPSDRIMHWGQQAPDSVKTLPDMANPQTIRIEDGFVRSVGLGSNFIAPLSIVMDDVGIYFDPRTPSRLENILNYDVFSDDDIEAARRVRASIVQNQITKYNVDRLSLISWQTDKRSILVTGQVEDDASIKLGASSVKTNLQLLAEVRRNNADAYIIYKPHPDVMSGNRHGKVEQRRALAFADRLESHASIISCIEASDELHCITSLSGFDALLRGKKVVTYGRPFYSGWGLTTDHDRVERRHRRLTLDQLVAGTLLKYPIYWDWRLGGFTSCESVLRELLRLRQRQHRGLQLDPVGRLTVVIQRALGLSRGLREERLFRRDFGA
ncbi:MAG: capsular polysaccharide biosynthesis protein [Burkholderiaceae bacterium]|nr:capsular polysaccharide biosynthesis protein [Burkholderiaceae bacterium]